MRKLKALLSVCLISAMSLSLAGCSSLSEVSDIIPFIPKTEPTAEVITDANVLVSKDGFILYKDGQNNYLKDLDSYAKTEYVPFEYYNYETLLNHSDEYNGSTGEIIKNDFISMAVVDELEYAKEVRFEYCGYNIHTIIPNSITSDCSLIGFSSESDLLHDYILMDSGESVFYLLSQSYEDDATLDKFTADFISDFNDEKYINLLNTYVPDIVTPFASSEFTTNQVDDLYIITSLAQGFELANTDIESLINGTVTLIFDAKNGNFITMFTGFRGNTNENYEFWGLKNALRFNLPYLKGLSFPSFERVSTVDKLSRWNVINNSALITSVTRSSNPFVREITDSTDDQASEDEYNFRPINEVEILCNLDYFSYDILEEPDFDSAVALVEPTLVAIAAATDKDDSLVSLTGGIYKVTPDSIYIISAGHGEVTNKNVQLSFANYDVLLIAPFTYVQTDDSLADVALYRVDTSNFSREFYTKIKELNIDRNVLDSLKVGDDVLLYTKKWNFSSTLLTKGTIYNLYSEDFHALLTRGLDAQKGQSGTPVFDFRGRMIGIEVFGFITNDPLYNDLDGVTRIDLIMDFVDENIDSI